MSSQELITIVDREDNLIGYKPRDEVTPNDIYRVSACWIKDELWNILLAQRAFTKKHNPWKWWPAVAWTNEAGETYRSNIIKEIKEEINIDIQESDLILWPKKFKNEDRSYFGQWFLLTYRGDKSVIKPEAWAVEQLKRYTSQELEDLITNHPQDCLTSLEWCFKNL